MRRWMVTIAPVWLAVGSCPSLSAQPALDSGPLDLAQAVHYALDHAPTLTVAHASVDSAAAQKLGAVAAFLPSLSLTDQPESFTPVTPAGSSVVGGVVIPNGHGYTANVTSAVLNMPLFVGGKNVANYRSSLKALSSASLALTAALDTTLDQLLTDFAATCVDQIAIEHQQRVVQLDQHVVELTVLRVRGTVADQVDLLQAQQQALQTQAQLSQSRQQHIADLEKVYADMGFPQITHNAVLRPWIPEAPVVPSEDAAIADDPAVGAARDAISAAEEKVSAARAEHYPTVALSFQYNFIGVDPSSLRRAFDDTRANNYSVGLNITVPLLPFLNASADIDSARAAVRNAQGQYQGALVSATNRVSDALLKLEEARTTLDLATRSADLARRNLQLVQDRYTARQADQRDVDSARVTATQAEQSFAGAEINFRLASWEHYRALFPQEFPTALLAAFAQSR